MSSIVSPTAIDDPRLGWFREAKFGMFVHFGLYALLGRGEWVQYSENIPRRKYARLARRFNPSRFDPNEWIDVAERAGCRYLNVTAKHHDGFCLFDSALTDYKITRTPFGRDLIGELIAACHRRGMRICLYYSQPDWHHPNFVHLPGAFKDLRTSPIDQAPDWPRYRRYYHGQVLELCTRYGRIDGIWFDGSHKAEETWQGRKIYRLIKRHQPGAIVNDRARYGDIFTPERSLPEDLTGYMFEVCQAVSRVSWGYHSDAPHFSLPNLVENLARVVGKGGNFLLNVGPMPDGRIPKEQAGRMAAIGRWLRIHGEAVYGSATGRIDTGSKDILATRKGDQLYLFLCRWPDGDRIVIPGVRTPPTTAKFLAGGSALTHLVSAQGLELSGLPMLGPDPVLNVIRLDFRRPPPLVIQKPTLPQPRTVNVSSQRATVLSVRDAGVAGFAVKGGRLRIEQPPDRLADAMVRNWMTPDQRLTWSVATPKAGAYRVRIRLACPKPFDGTVFSIRGKLGTVEGCVKPTAAFTTYAWQPVGELRLPRGKSRLTLRPIRMPYGYIFAYVTALSLQPSKGTR